MLKELKQSDFPMKIIKDLGMEYTYPDNPKGRTYRHIILECECGAQVRRQIGNAKRDKKCKSCGQKTHGCYYTKLYKRYNDMLARCYNKKHRDYPNYGGRGITVRKDWRNNFLIFKTWADKNGYKEGLELDRKNNNSSYTPFNCRWVTRAVQCQNRRKTKSKTSSQYKGVTFIKATNKWVGLIHMENIRYRLGTFKTEKEAAIAYNNWIIINKTDHTLNIIKD